MVVLYVVNTYIYQRLTVKKGMFADIVKRMLVVKYILLDPNLVKHLNVVGNK
jgi:hypothetical protein